MLGIAQVSSELAENSLRNDMSCGKIRYTASKKLTTSKEKYLIMFIRKQKNKSPDWLFAFEGTSENHLPQSRLNPSTVELSSL